MTYDQNLRHVAEPAAPSGREKAVSASLPDYDALWLAEALREYAHYGDHPDESHRDIATAYVEFIDMKVREEERRHVTLYAHTDEAADTLMGAMFHADDDERHIESVSTALADLYVEQAEGDVPEPSAVEEHDTVEFCDGAAEAALSDESDSVESDEVEGAAGEAIAEAEMARAESEALAKQERRAERAMEEGRI